MMIERTRQKRAISNESEDVGEVEEVEGKAGKEQGEGETGSEPSSPQSSVHGEFLKLTWTWLMSLGQKPDVAQSLCAPTLLLSCSVLLSCR
jgi:hypothetical protein